jgi:hypothetical protein
LFVLGSSESGRLEWVWGSGELGFVKLYPCDDADGFLGFEGVLCGFASDGLVVLAAEFHEGFGFFVEAGTSRLTTVRRRHCRARKCCLISRELIEWQIVFYFYE